MKFYKMISLNNDYLVTEYEAGKDYAEVAKKVCNRTRGIGAKGLIVCKKEPLKIVGYNHNGEEIVSDIAMISIFTRFIYDHKFITKRGFDIFNQTYKETVLIDNLEPFKASMMLHRAPSYEKSMMGIMTIGEVFGRVISVNDIKITIYPLYYYGTHTIVFVDDFRSKSVLYRKKIAENEIYIKKSLIDFVKVDKKSIEVMTYNPDDDTLSENLNAAMAAFYVMNKIGMCKNKLTVKLESNELKLELDKNNCCKIDLDSKYIFNLDMEV